MYTMYTVYAIHLVTNESIVKSVGPHACSLSGGLICQVNQSFLNNLTNKEQTIMKGSLI